VITSRKLLALAALLPFVGAAADQTMMELVMPDARVVAHIHLGRILASPIGQALKTEVDKAQPQWQQQLISTAGVDLSKVVDEVLIASTAGTGKNPPTLLIVRGSFDPAQVMSWTGGKGKMTEFEGVPMLLSTGKDDGAVAFLDGSLAVLGSPEDVKAAIRRRGHGGPVGTVAEKLSQFEGRYDVWVVANGPFPALPSKASNGPVKADFLQHIEAVQGGARFSPDFELSAEIVLRSEKDAAGMADGVRWLQGVLSAQQQKAGKDNFSVDLRGRRLLITLRASEQEMIAELRKRAAHSAALPASAHAPSEPAPTVSSSSVPPPPPNTIRVTSSPKDMGTVLVPSGKGQ